MKTSREARHILRSLPSALRNVQELPDGQRSARLVGVPLHLLELAALGGLRLLPEGAFRPGKIPDGKRGPVLLVHGYAGHPSSHAPMRRYLAERGFSAFSVNLRGCADVREMSVRLSERLLEIAALHGPVHVVAHSLGGLVARLSVCEDGMLDELRSIVTLGTPHQGTRVASLVDSELADALETNSELAWRLEEQEPWGAHLPPLVCLWSRADLLVVPPRYAVADGAREQEVEGATHYGYVLRPRVWRRVARVLRDLEEEAPQPAAQSTDAAGASTPR